MKEAFLNQDTKPKTYFFKKPIRDIFVQVFFFFNLQMILFAVYMIED